MTIRFLHRVIHAAAAATLVALATAATPAAAETVCPSSHFDCGGGMCCSR